MVNLISILFLQLSWGQPSIDALLSATSTAGLLRAEAQFNQELLWHRRCEMEIEWERFPENCLHWMEHAWGHPSLLSLAQKRQSKVTRLCERGALGWGNLEKVGLLLELTSLQPPCRKALDSRQADLVYLERGTSARHLKIGHQHGEAESTKHPLRN